MSKLHESKRQYSCGNVGDVFQGDDYTESVMQGENKDGYDHQRREGEPQLVPNLSSEQIAPLEGMESHQDLTPNIATQDEATTNSDAEHHELFLYEGTSSSDQISEIYETMCNRFDSIIEFQVTQGLDSINDALNQIVLPSPTEIDSGLFTDFPAQLQIKNPMIRNSGTRGLIVKNEVSKNDQQVGFQPGSIIHHFKPCLQVLNPVVDKQHEMLPLILSCSNCMNGIDSVEISCPQCNKLWYCSEECRENDWKLHSVECLYLRLKKNLDEEEDSVSRIIIRLLTACSQDVNLLTKCKVLTSHHELYWEARNFPRYIKWCQDTAIKTNDFLKEMLVILNKDINLEGVIKLVYIIYVNSTVSQNWFNEATGLMFDPFFSLINHSCDPNCTLVWGGDTVTLRALKYIGPGEELFVTYVPVSLSTSERRGILQKNFYFNCTCEVCQLTYERSLPVCCLNCKSTNQGISEEEFETNFNAKIASEVAGGGGFQVRLRQPEVTCYNCDTIINRRFFVQLYLQSTKVLQSFAPECQTLSELRIKLLIVDERELLRTMTNENIRLFVQALRCASKFIPFHSWPIYKIVVILSFCYKDSPIEHLRFQLIILFGIENHFESTYPFKPSLGLALYEFNVALLKTIFFCKDENKRKPYHADLFDNLQTLQYSALVISLLSYKKITEMHSLPGSNLEDANNPIINDLKDMAHEVISQMQSPVISNKSAMRELSNLSKLLDCNIELTKVLSDSELLEEDAQKFGLCFKEEEEDKDGNILHPHTASSLSLSWLHNLNNPYL
ncbi:hypothetical protein CANARDRAFT_20806 [[Candida] arabinofermentans NRRL YB-2248]|uniref:MYND-type domain-containing protein n=1 Tax=[Candida] arabinofermentans NRRL YB-2248 TaxID=983967 RepID=A0A1E4T8K8_9ASCO|nr:hypothetical protein CANARDRAFT_20806 [[Candida] arabinofermentans NRRL YB-2248]